MVPRVPIPEADPPLRILVDKPKVVDAARLLPGFAQSYDPALKASTRNCIESHSRRRTFLDSEASSEPKDGPLRTFLPTLPKLPDAGRANAAGLKKRRLVESAGPGLPRAEEPDGCESSA